MLKINLNQLSNPKIIINLFFCLIPLSFIIGNLAININITLLSVLSLFFFKEKIFLQEKTFLDKLIYFFFIYILLVLIINLIELNFFKVLIINHFDNFNLYLISKTIFFF